MQTQPTTDFTDKGGKAFAEKKHLIRAMEKAHVSENFFPVQFEDGWIGKRMKKKAIKRYKCRVWRSNVDPDNRDVPISVCVNKPSNRKLFSPGQETILDASQIGALRDAVAETRLEIPAESGIYQSSDPVALARSTYPDMTPEIHPATGAIIMVKREPNYVVEVIGEADRKPKPEPETTEEKAA